MSDCLHCEILDLVEPHLQTADANLAEVVAKVTEVLADLVLLAPPADRAKLMADILANFGEFVLQKDEDNIGGEAQPRRH